MLRLGLLRLTLLLSVLACSLPYLAYADAANDPGMSEARALFLAGRVAFDEGRFEAALKYFEASYEQSQRPLLLYNIAQCYDRLRRDEATIAAFERYLAADPGAEHRPLIEARIRAIKAALDERARQERDGPAQAGGDGTAPTLAASEPASSAAPTAANRAWFLPGSVTLGAGAAVALGGGVLMVVGKQTGDSVEKAHVGASYARLHADQRRAQREWLAGQVLLGVGGAAALGGLVWLLVKRPREEKRVELSLGTSSLGVRGVF